MINKRKCKYVDPHTGKNCKSIAPMANNLCQFHGGIGTKTKTALSKYRKEVHAKIQKIKEGSGISGETLAKAIDRIELDPYYRDLNYEVNVLAAMIESVQKELVNYGPADPEYKMLYEQMIKMTDVRSKSRERFARISASYVDIYALKLVITQIVTMFGALKSDLNMEFANDSGALKRMLSIIDKHIGELDRVKLPLVRENK